MSNYLSETNRWLTDHIDDDTAVDFARRVLTRQFLLPKLSQQVMLLRAISMPTSPEDVTIDRSVEISGDLRGNSRSAVA